MKIFLSKNVGGTIEQCELTVEPQRWYITEKNYVNRFEKRDGKCTLNVGWTQIEINEENIDIITSWKTDFSLHCWTCISGRDLSCEVFELSPCPHSARRQIISEGWRWSQMRFALFASLSKWDSIEQQDYYLPAAEVRFLGEEIWALFSPGSSKTDAEHLIRWFSPQNESFWNRIRRTSYVNGQNAPKNHARHEKLDMKRLWAKISLSEFFREPVRYLSAEFYFIRCFNWSSLFVYDSEELWGLKSISFRLDWNINSELSAARVQRSIIQHVTGFGHCLW